MARHIDEIQIRAFLSQGLSQNEISRRTGIPRTTLKRHLKNLCTPSVYTGTPQTINEGTPKVYKGTQIPDQIIESWDDLQEMVAVWRERKRLATTPADPERETQRQTYHVEKRFIDLIKRAADLERVSITEIVNRAFQQFFDSTSTPEH